MENPMANLDKLVNEKLKLFDLDDFMKEVRIVQRDVFKESIDFYIAELNRSEEKSWTDKSSLAATAVNRYEKRLTDAINKSAGYQSAIRNYLTDFSKVDKLNLEIHSLKNGININKIIKAANASQRDLIGKTAEGIVSSIKKTDLIDSFSGMDMRKQFTQPVKRIIYQNLMMGTPGSELKSQLHSFIIGQKRKGGRIGQLERWTGQIARDALSQYDGAINDMVRKEFDLNAFRYIGSLVTDSRPQCVRWITKKKGVLRYDELTRELARSGNKGQIPGTNKDNFSTYKGGFNCKHTAIPFRLEETENQIIE